MTTSIQVLQPYFSPEGLINAGETIGVSSAVATAMVAAGAAVLVNGGTPTASPFRGQNASETDAQFIAAGGSSGNENPSAAIQGYTGAVTIVRGRNVPNSEPWA
jgi:hypothetical protein